MVLVLNGVSELGESSRAKNLKIDFTGSYSIFGSTMWKKMNKQHASPFSRKSTPSAKVIKGTLHDCTSKVSYKIIFLINKNQNNCTYKPKPDRILFCVCVLPMLTFSA